MNDNKSLCDTCVYKHSWANHTICYRYVTDKNILNYEGSESYSVPEIWEEISKEKYKRGDV